VVAHNRIPSTADYSDKQIDFDSDKSRPFFDTRESSILCTEVCLVVGDDDADLRIYYQQVEGEENNIMSQVNISRGTRSPRNDSLKRQQRTDQNTPSQPIYVSR